MTSSLSFKTQSYLKNSSLNSTSIYLRKEIRELSEDELDNFFAALWEYKTNGRQDGFTYLETYDDIVAQHALAAMNTTIDQNHVYAAFVIWHSVFIYELEIALQSIDSTVTVPYWDWTLDAHLGSPYECEVFTEKYFGEVTTADNNYMVNTSRLAEWPISQTPFDYVWWESPQGYLKGPDNYNPNPFITRKFNMSFPLPELSSYEYCLDEYATYATFWYCVWGYYTGLENIHIPPHLTTGGMWSYTGNSDLTDVFQFGDMYDFQCSPNDPLFFLHHSFLDKLYLKWKVRVGEDGITDDDPCIGYYGTDLYNSYPQPAGHNLNDQFVPPFYAFRSGDEITTAGGLSIAEACYYLDPVRAPYSYTGM